MDFHNPPVEHKTPREVKFIEKTETDPEIACRVVDHIFAYISYCLKNDKNKVKLNLMTRSFISSILTDSTKKGIQNFIKNMNDKDIENLLEDIQGELDKRI